MFFMNLSQILCWINYYITLLIDCAVFIMHLCYNERTWNYLSVSFERILHMPLIELFRGYLKL